MRLKRLAGSAAFSLASAISLGSVFLLALVLPLAQIAAAPPALASAPRVNATPNPSTPGTPTLFSVSCGSSATSATLFAATLGLPDQVPMQPVTRTGDFAVTATLPATTSPGMYIVDIHCSDGFSANATLTVGTGPARAPQAGDGTTSTATNTPALAAGAGLLGLAALLGGVLHHKRKQVRRH